MPELVKKGNFKDIPFARVFYSIAGREKTGILTVRNPEDNLVLKKVYFLAGDSAFVEYGPIEEALGQILLKAGKLSEEDLEEVLEELALSEDKDIGEILLEKGLLTQEELETWLKKQVELKLVSLFALKEGNFEFEEIPVSKFQFSVKLFPIVPEQIIYQGIKKHYDLRRLEKELEPLKEKWIKLRLEWEKKKEFFLFSVEEKKLIEQAREGKAFARLIASSDLPLAETLKIVYILLLCDLLEVEERKSIKEFEEPPVKIPRRSRVIELEEVEPEQTAQELNLELEQVPVGGDEFPSPSPPPASRSSAQPAVAKKPASEPEPIEDEKALVKQKLSDLLLSNLREAVDAYLPGRTGGVKIGELLVQNKIIDSIQLNEAIKRMREKGTSLLNTLCEMGAIEDDDLSDFLSKYYKVPAVNLKEMELDQEIVSLIPEELAKKYKAIPINRTGRTLVVAMADPTNLQAIEEIEFLTDYKVEPVVATENQIKEAIDKFHDSAAMLDEVMSTFDDSDINLAEIEEDDVDISELEKASEEAPVVKLVNHIIFDAIQKGASDIHFEPYENAFRIRYRIDGVLYPIVSPPYKLKNAVVSRLKIMSKLDIAERRLPQDGRMSMKVGNKKLDFRVSTLPTMWGEKVVLRILDKSSLELDLTKLGMEPEQLEAFRWGISQPYGMVLVTGPSGCGKTTTLYSSLLELNKVTDNISTAEDPVEYYLEGINQVQMQDEIGLNFAFTLRAFLRQDPDIIMVGEIRDFETAEIAIKAALTGHLVLSTVHTNDAPSTISRLLNMGIEPFLITASLNTVVSQRLVRKLCPNCMEPVEIPKRTLIEMGVPPEEVDDFVPYVGRGCPECAHRGYKGRIGLFEVLTVRGEISELILAGATPAELKREAIRLGMKTLRQAGLTKVKNKITTLEEVTRTTMPDFVRTSEEFEDIT